MPDAARMLRAMLAERTSTDPDDWHLVFRARHGMLVVMSELRRLRGEGAVLTQLLTCCTAVDPIVAAGLAPIYGDVSERTYALDPQALPSVRNVHGIVDQHSFGYIDAPASQALRAAANERGAVLLEDCAHCVGRMAVGPDGTPLADFSFHSFGVEKMLPTYFGGAVWVNPAMADVALRDAVVAALSALPEPRGRLARAERSYGLQIRVLNHLPAGLARPLRSLLVACGAFEPAISAAEMAGGIAHDPHALDAWACEQVIGQLRALDTDLRVAALAGYARELSDIEGLTVSTCVLGSGQPLLRLPLNLASDVAADAALAAIGAHGLYAVPWYRPVLYPGVTDAARYGFDGSLDAFPHTQALTKGALAVPCDLSDAQVTQVVAGLRDASVGA